MQTGEAIQVWRRAISILHLAEARILVMAGLALTGTACGDEPDPRGGVPSGEVIAGLPGRIHIGPGGAPIRTVDFENPYAGDPAAMEEGKRLYTWYNCAGCHGVMGGGGMGPPLRDAKWIYGNEPVSVFESIMEGRPNGMPTWQGKIPEDQVWKMVAYILSLGEHAPPEAEDTAAVEAGGRNVG